MHTGDLANKNVNCSHNTRFYGSLARRVGGLENMDSWKGFRQGFQACTPGFGDPSKGPLETTLAHIWAILRPTGANFKGYDLVGTTQEPLI